MGMGLFLAAPAPNPARALVMRLPAIGFGAAEVAAAGFGADESDEVTVADAATDAATDATDVPDLSVNYHHFSYWIVYYNCSDFILLCSRLFLDENSSIHHVNLIINFE